MLIDLFIIFFILALVFLIMAIVMEYTEHKYWTIVFTFLTMSMWIVCALGVIELQIPYQIFNSTAGSEHVETGYQTYSELPYLSYIFLGIAISCMIYLVTLAFKPIIEAFAGTKYNRRK